MAEARKLNSSHLPALPDGGDGRPPTHESPESHENSDRQAVFGLAEALPPLPDAVRTVPVPRSSSPTPTARATAPHGAKKGGAARALLALFLVGLASFIGTAALTSAIVMGMLDVKTGGLKDSLKTVKAFVTQFKS